MLVPPIVRRREMDRNLVQFFREHRIPVFRRAISAFCRYYNVKSPRIEWYEYIDWGKTAGKTFEDGRIHLVHPENWKRGRVYNSERMWVQTVYHELAHYLFWTDAEAKAEAFTQRMVRGLRRTLQHAGKLARPRVATAHIRIATAHIVDARRARAARVAARRIASTRTAARRISRRRGASARTRPNRRKTPNVRARSATAGRRRRA